MKYVLASIAALVLSCTANPPILPEPTNATTGVGGFGGNGGAGGMDASSSSASSNSSSSASGSGGSPLPGDGSGTRLKRYVYTSADGLISGHSGAFYDSLLATDCTPTKTIAGTRCIPSPAGVGWFVDDQCTIPAAYTLKQCAVPKYGCAYGAFMCVDSGPATCYTIMPTPLSKAYVPNNGACVDVSAQLQTYTFYAVGQEVDYAQFAAVTLEHE